MENALNGNPMKVYNGAETFLDFTYVEDLAKSLIAIAMNSKKFNAEIFNVTRGRARSLLEVADIIKHIVPGSALEETLNKENLDQKGEPYLHKKYKKK